MSSLPCTSLTKATYGLFIDLWSSPSGGWNQFPTCSLPYLLILPLVLHRSVPFPFGMIHPMAPKDTFLWGSLGGVPIATALVLCLASAHPSLASGPGTHKHHQGENQPPDPGKVIAETHKDCLSHL